MKSNECLQITEKKVIYEQKCFVFAIFSKFFYSHPSAQNSVFFRYYSIHCIWNKNEDSYHKRKIFCTVENPLRKKLLFFILFYFIYLWHLHMAKLFAVYSSFISIMHFSMLQQASFKWYQLSYICYSFLQYDLPSSPSSSSSSSWA